MSRNKMIPLVMTLLSVTIVFSGCGKKEEQKSVPNVPAQQEKVEQHIVMSKFGPAKTKAGQAFNKQPDGSSAFWVNGEGITSSTVVVLNKSKIKSYPKSQGKLVTAGPVPKELFSTPGVYPIYLQDTKTGARSNELKFIVQ